jgi:aminoglycoside phosphotransferase (APT) family kinase protein
VPDGAPTGIDLTAFARWSDGRLPQFRAPFSAALIVGGQSNITAHMTDADGKEFVLRRPPLHGVLPTAHDMGREHRIIAALGPTPVPVPEALAFCDDADVIGAPFYVMSYVAGIVLNDLDTAEAELDVGARAHSGESLVDALVELHAVDIDAVGLGDLARRDELVRRQLKRWYTQFEASKSREVPAVDRAHEILAARIPEQTESTVVHGDFRLGNCVVDPQGEILAVLDWEICTLGDPRADVGYVLATWAEPGDPLRADDHNPTLAPGFATRTSLLERYADGSGRDVADIPYFVAFSFWRLACILEGVLSRSVSGARGDTGADVDYLRRRVESCAQLAEEYASGL